MTALCLATGLLGIAAPAQGAPSDPLFVFTPVPSGFLSPPPLGFLEGPCGMGVDPAGRFYVSDYHHDAVDAYDQNANYNSIKPPVTGATGYLGQLAGIDSIDGPCGLAFDAAGRLYVNDYHRAVKRYGPLGSFGAATTITGAMLDGSHPTGVAVDPATGRVYVDARDHVAVFEEGGEPAMEGGEPLLIGADSLQDGYGIAFSTYPGTAGRLYLPDAATNTVEVYDSATPDAGPVQEIDATDTPDGGFASLRDSSIAVDRVTGEIYLVDDLQPEYTEAPQAIVYVFNPDGTYEGHLKLLVTDAMPAGLAVDNSQTATQGRVYVTSGNSAFGSIYAYGPEAATTAPLKLETEAGGTPGDEPASPSAAPSAQTYTPAPQWAASEAASSAAPGAMPRALPRRARRRHGARNGRAPRHRRRHMVQRPHGGASEPRR